MKALKTLFAMVVASMVMNANASVDGPATPAPVELVNVPGLGAVPYQKLFEEASNDGESLDAFMLRIGVRLRDFSDASKHEACGVVATDGQRFGVVIGTNGAHIACANFPWKVPQGMRAIGETIHSHGADKLANINKVDRLFRGEELVSGRRVSSVSGQDLAMFSREDFTGGPGYLAIPGGRVLHQSGKSTVREVTDEVAADLQGAVAVVPR